MITDINKDILDRFDILINMTKTKKNYLLYLMFIIGE